MSVQSLSNYTIYAKYARYLPDKKRRESWSEMIDRVFDMHEKRFSKELEQEEFRKDFDFAKLQVKKKRVLGAQRILQFGGDPILKHNAKCFNCAYSYIDRIIAFQEIMYLLLCGCGVGFSVLKRHVKKLPTIHPINKSEHIIYTPEDSIEGWANCVGVLVQSYFNKGEYANKNIHFDFSNIRPEGSLIAGQFKAPGAEGLKKALEKVRSIFEIRLNLEHTPLDRSCKLHPIDVYDIIMHMSNAVLSGGVRRSATICLFDKTDNEMMMAKTGNWFDTNPQRARSNNSVLLVKSECTKEDFKRIIDSAKQFGEPGFVFMENEDCGVNPCCEIAMYPQTKSGKSGFQFCNLVEINGKYCDTKSKFFQACRAAAIIGTMQAAYTDFTYLSPETKEITDREALLGCSITGIMDNPEILLHPEIQKEGAREIKRINAKIAKLININPGARTTCVKPAGTTSCVLGTSSGVHPHHARRYIRRVQANYLEFPVQKFQEINPLAVENSVWSASATDKVISFLCEVPFGAITKNDSCAIELLEAVKLTQQNWVEAGTNKDLCSVPGMRHNVSNTISVKDDEWDKVSDYIFTNRKWFSGISLLPASGDLDYPQAPFATVLNAKEIVEEYGDAAVFASGLIVDGLHAFNDNLWDACSIVLSQKEIKNTQENFPRIDWKRRLNQFSLRYFNGNLRKATHCLKHVSLWKTWCDLKRDYKEIDWSAVVEDTETHVDATTLGAQACSGGACLL